MVRRGKVKVDLQSSLDLLLVVKLAAIVCRDGSDPMGFFAEQGEGPARCEFLGRTPQRTKAHQARAPFHHGEHARGALAMHSVDLPMTNALARLD